MDPLKDIWDQLDSDSRTLLITAALIPPPISLDLWAKVASATSVAVLQLAEKLVRLHIMQVYEPLGIGHYYFQNPKIISDLMGWAGSEITLPIARNLSRIFSTEYQDGPHRWMALAYLYQTTDLNVSDLTTLIKAAQFCLDANLPEDAATYYQLIIERSSGEFATVENGEIYTDAVIGLCRYREKNIPLLEQDRLLSKALSFCRLANDPKRTAMILANIGQVNKALGNYDKASSMFEEAWDQAIRTGSEELIKQVALTSTNFLMWQGRIAETIERYENVLGNLEELPSDEPSLVACAQLGWIYGKCGQTVRGIGLINLVMDKAEELELDRLRTHAKIVAINTLHDARRNVEAEALIEELSNIPHESMERYVLWPFCAAKAYVHACRGEHEAAFEMQQEAYQSAKLLNNLHHRGPINFDYMDILEDAGYIHPEMNYESEVQRVINWPDIYMQGVGYYFRAKRTIKKKGFTASARNDLNKSLELLTRSGARLDLAFTQILLGQLLIHNDENELAEPLLKEAWRVVAPVNKKLFPEELLPRVMAQSQDAFLLDALTQISETLGTIRSRQELLKQIITMTLQLTGAERGAFFIPSRKDEIEMIASRNIAPEQFLGETLSEVLRAIKQVMNTGKEVISANSFGTQAPSAKQATPGWQIIYPVKLQGNILGSFFLERNLSGFAVPERILTLLKAISTQVAVALDNVRAYEEIAELKELLEAETLFYRNKPSTIPESRDILGESDKIKEVISKIADVAQSNTTVLIIGETGVGKELVAKAIHQMSNRSHGPFIPVSISSLSESLIASELFGHEKGAFTNALQTRRGRFELANNGTLFLDEINSLSLDVQIRLLRVLEEKVFERVGGSTSIRPNFRLIAATNQPLNSAVKEGTFRPDLYYRLNVYPITVPPLRERKEDIALLVSFFVKHYNRKFGKSFTRINKCSLQALEAYDWPGNVRELKHTVERAVLSCKEKQLKFQDINPCSNTVTTSRKLLSLREMERQYILTALAECEWKVSGATGAATLLDLNPQTLYSKIKRLGIRKNVTMELQG